MSQEKEFSSSTTIRDEKISPYYISKDAYCYTIFEERIPDPKFATEKSKTYVQSIGHYTDFTACLNKIAKLKVDSARDYTSIKDYISEWERVKNEINEIINFGL